MQAGSRKNIYAISEVVPDTDNRNLQQFITHSKWSACEVLDHVAHDADEWIGDGSDAALMRSSAVTHGDSCGKIEGTIEGD